MWKTTKRIFRIILGIWFFFTFTAFLSGAFISFLNFPGWIEIPWSDVKDFVATSDGKVFVSLGFYRKVLLYDENGDFIESKPYPDGKLGRLAVDESDNVYFWSKGAVFVFDKNWNQVKTVNELSLNRDCNGWKLESNEQLTCINEENAERRVVSKAVEKGEVLFSYDTQKRTIFNNKDGSTLYRGWFTITRYSADGKILTEYHTPWYLVWAVFPFPGILAWVALFILAGRRKLKNRP